MPNVALGAENNWINPVDGIITGYFGERENPILKKQEFHNGLDIGADENSPVYAVKSGIVTDVGSSNTYGIYIKYKTYDNYEIMYAHLNEALVEKDDKININEKIGLVGNTGLSTGFHLHYTILKNGEYVDPINFVALPKASYLK
nr:M23 family metallopeptidase [uncultured Tyzzerella sp.]